MLNYFAVFLVGLVFGSFISAASYRLPRDIGLLLTRSACTKCGAVLKAIDLIPVLSWVFNRGQCRHCKAKVSVRYIITELVTAFGFCGLWYVFGNTVNFYIFASLYVALLITIISDFETYIMPDSCTAAALIVGVMYVHFNGMSWGLALGGFVACLFVALGMHYGYKLIMKKDGLGFGDVKFLPVAGLWVGVLNLPVYFMLSGLVGILTAIYWRIVFKNPVFPFGPSLAVVMFGVAILTQSSDIFPIDIAKNLP
jgi:prepilin signal peptidase PulO-like enzyme (type II secretory pathway)